MKTVAVTLATFAFAAITARAAEPDRPGQKGGPAPVQRSFLNDVTFPVRPLDKKDLNRWETLANGMAIPALNREPWHIHHTNSDQYYRTSWSKSSADETERGKLHKVELQANPYSRDLQKIGWIRLDAKWRPPKTGWGADLRCETGGVSKHNKSDPSVKRWFIFFREYSADSRTEVKSLGFFPNLLIYYDNRRYEDTKYDLYVAVGPAKSFCVGDAELRGWIESPKSLRDTGLAFLDRLNAAFERQVRSGEAVRSAHKRQAATRHRGQSLGMVAIPPPRHNLPKATVSDRPLSNVEQDEVIRDARKQLATRKKLLRDHHQEMHAALLETFPLLKYLPPAERP